MTVTTQLRVNTYIGTSLTTIFPFNFPVYEADHLEVRLYDLTTNLYTLIPSTDYTASGIGSSSVGGAVTYNPGGVPIPNSKLIAIYRTLPYTQELDIINQSGFYPDVIERQLDEIVMQIQQLAEVISRVFVLPPTGGVTAEDLINQILAVPDFYAQMVVLRDEAADYAAQARNNFVEKTFALNGVTTTFDLLTDPGSVNNTFAFIDGVFQERTGYTLNGTVLTFSSAPTGSSMTIAFGSRVAVGTPADGSITEPKHATGGVSTRALADGSATKVKLAASSVDASKLDLTDIVNLMAGLRISNVRQFGAVTGVGGTLATSSGTFAALGNNFSITRKSTTSKLLVLGLAHASLATTANQSVGGQLQMQYYTGAAYSAAPGNSSAELTDTSGQSSTRILRAPLSTMSILTQTELRSDTPTIWTVQFFGRQTQSTTTLTLTGYSILFVEFD